MLPSKRYFNSLECPFYLSPTKCFRPYCHFKHPKRDTKTAENDQKTQNHVAENTTRLSTVPVVEKPVIPPVKHIPIAYIPTKPTAISINTKKPKMVYVPSSLSNSSSVSKTCNTKPTDYDPLSIVESSEKTYSRYSYEKGHDSGDEIMENHKNFIETNIGKYDDGSKSGYDEETDDYPDEAQFSQEEDDGTPDLLDTPNFPDVDTDTTMSEVMTNFKIVKNEKESKCKKKRKHSVDESRLDSDGTNDSFDRPREKTDRTSVNHFLTSNLSKKIKTETLSKSASLKLDKSDEVKQLSSLKNKQQNKTVSPPKKIKIEEDSASESVEINRSEKKVCKYKDKKRTAVVDKLIDSKDDSNHKNQSHLKKNSTSKKNPSEDKKHPTDKKRGKNEKHSSKPHSSQHKQSESSKKQETNSNTPSSDPKKNASENNRKHSSSDKKYRSDNKKHSDKELSKTCKPTSDSNKHSSADIGQTKAVHSSDHRKKKKPNEKEKYQSKNKTHSDHSNKYSSSKSRNNDKSHSKDDSGKHSDKKKHNSSSKHSSSNKSKTHPNQPSKTHPNRVPDKIHKHNKRKRSESFDSVVSTEGKKETILISDSSDSERTSVNKNYQENNFADIDDILGFSDGDNGHEISESENDDEYTPVAVTSSTDSPIYKPSAVSNSVNETKQNFKSTLPTVDETYKPAQTASKIRIAHVPNVSSLLNAKNMINSGKTVPSTIHKLVSAISVINPSKNIDRSFVPHQSASCASKPRPKITFNLDSVISVSIRQPGLNNIYDELIKFVDYDQACRRAIDEETEICNVATNPQSYRNRIALCILKIRKSKGAVDVVKKEKITSDSKPEYTYGLTLYECFSKYLLKPDDFVLHGYPLELPGKPGCVYIDKSSYFRNKHKGPTEGPFRKCLNCGQEYAVDEETDIPLIKNDCHHHWGKPIGMRQGKIYSCCKSDIGSDPCHTSLYHVTEMKSDDCLEGFVKTKPYPSDADPLKAGIYAMDCEMCFTTRGRDIVRASLLAVDNESVYDVLIKPKDPVLDYCTRFSGITEEKLASVTTTLEDVQKFLLKTVSDKTILVGHSLENDLKALKLVHYNVIDTSVMFPHKEGLPVKCALRTLCSRILGQAIQTGEHGHDSLEDARACLQLVLHKVKEDAKSRKPRIVKQLKAK